MKHNEQLYETIKETYAEDLIDEAVVKRKKRRLWPAVSAILLAAAICSVPAMVSQHIGKTINGKSESLTDISIPSPPEYTHEERYIPDEAAVTYDYHVTEKFSAENMRADSITPTKDCIYLSGYADNKRDKVVSYLYNAEKREFTYLDFKIDDMDYIYDEILLGDRILLRYVNTDDDRCIALADASSGNIIVSKLDRFYTSDLYLNHDGDIVAYDYDMRKNIDKIIINPETLEVKTKSSISLGKEPGWEYIISHIFLNQDGTEYILFEKSFDESDNVPLKLYKTSEKGKTDFMTDIKSGPDEKIDDEVFFRKANGNICFGSYEEYGELYITELKASDGSKADKYPAESLGYVHVFMKSADGEDYHYTTNQGLWKYNPETNESECIFSADDELTGDCLACNYVSCSGNLFSFYEVMYSGSTSDQKIYIMDYEGNITEDETLKKSEDDYYNPFTEIYRVNNNGELVRTYRKYSFDSEKLTTINSDGSVKSSVDISEIEERTGCFTADFYPLYDGETMIFCAEFDEEKFCVTGGVLVFLNEEGKPQYSIDTLLCYIEGFASSDKGTFFGCCDEYNRFGVSEADTENKEVHMTDIRIPLDAVIINPVDDYDFCYYTEKGIYGYCVDERKEETLIEFDEQKIQSAASIDGKVVCDVLDRYDYGRYIYIVEKNYSERQN